jgi:hypothetical protein
MVDGPVEQGTAYVDANVQLSSAWRVVTSMEGAPALKRFSCYTKMPKTAAASRETLVDAVLQYGFWT